MPLAVKPAAPDGGRVSRDGEGFLGMANSFTEQRKGSSLIPYLPLGRWWTHNLMARRVDIIHVLPRRPIR
jgi:hypothetical protein